jgi:hypothetical protein
MPCDLASLYPSICLTGVLVLSPPLFYLSLFAISRLLDRAGYDGPLSLGLSSRATSPITHPDPYMPSPTAGLITVPSYEDFLWRVIEQQDYEEQIHRQVGIGWHLRYGVTKGASALDYRARSVGEEFIQLLPDDPTRYPVFVQPHEWDLPTEELVITFIQRTLPWQADLALRTRRCTSYTTLGLPDPVIEIPVTKSAQWKELWTAPSVRHALRRLHDSIQPRLAAQEAWVCMYRQALAENDAVRVPHRHIVDPWRHEPLYRLRRDGKRRILEVSHVYTEPAIREGLKTYHRIKNGIWEEIAKRPELRGAYQATAMHAHEKPIWDRLVREHNSPHLRHHYISDDDSGVDDEDPGDSDCDMEGVSVEANPSHKGTPSIAEPITISDAIEGLPEDHSDEPPVLPGYEFAHTRPSSAIGAGSSGELLLRANVLSLPLSHTGPLPEPERPPSKDDELLVKHSKSSGDSSLPGLIPVSDDETPETVRCPYRCMKVTGPETERDVNRALSGLPSSRPCSNDESPTTLRSGSADLETYSFVVQVPMGCPLHVGVPHVHIFPNEAPVTESSRYRAMSRVYDEREMDLREPEPVDDSCRRSAREEGDPLFVGLTGNSDSGSGELTGLGLYRSRSWPLDSRTYRLSTNASAT